MRRIVVLGAGYAGLPAINRIARQTYRDEVELVLVSRHSHFVERPRLHQLATGQLRPDLPLSTFLRPGVTLRTGHVTSLDTRGRRLVFDEAGPVGELEYDTLVYAPGSTIDTASVPGVAEHAETLADPQASIRMATTLKADPAARIAVCGGGLTGLELVTEVAESFPRATVTLVTQGEVGDWLSDRARQSVIDALDDLRVDVVPRTRIARVQRGLLETSDGCSREFDICLWAGGFSVPDLASRAGLAVDGRGRVVTDSTLRSRSDPDVYAIGDAAAVPGPWGDALAMGCRTGAFMGPVAADAVVARLAGRPAREFTFRYIHECLSLGRHHAVIQFLNRDGSPKARTLRGRPAIAYKNVVLDSGRMVLKHSGPFRPVRRRHLDELAPAGDRRRGVNA